MKALPFLFPALAFGAAVYTGQYDIGRTGANTAETAINQANVALLHKTGQYAVTGNIWAQPLVATGVPISGSQRDLLIVATSQDNIYAFDADAPGSPAIWTVNVGTQCHVPQASNYLFDSNNGILGTPVIDPSTNVVYFVACTGGPSSYVSSLYALNLADGSSYHAPVTITAVVGSITFNAGGEMQRPALLLLGSNVYAAYGSYNDQYYGTATNWYGWVISYDKTSLAQSHVYVNSQEEVSFWMAGGGLSSDGTSIWGITANDAGENAAGNNPESFLSFDVSLNIIDSMQPANWATLDTHDADLGTGRAIVSGSYIYGGGKDGRFWVLDKGAMNTSPQVWQATIETFAADYNGYVIGDGNLFLAPAGCCGMEVVSRYSCPSTCTTTADATSAFMYQFSALAYTSNGGAMGTHLLWQSVANKDASGNLGAVPGTLNVFNADTLSLIYSDPLLGNVAKFVQPTVVNGKAYMATDSGYVQSYALSPQPTFLLIGKVETQR